MWWPWKAVDLSRMFSSLAPSGVRMGNVHLSLVRVKLMRVDTYSKKRTKLDHNKRRKIICININWQYAKAVTLVFLEQQAVTHFSVWSAALARRLHTLTACSTASAPSPRCLGSMPYQCLFISEPGAGLDYSYGAKKDSLREPGGCMQPSPSRKNTILPFSVL